MSKVWCEALDGPEVTGARITSEAWFGYALSFPPGAPAPRPFPDTTVEVASEQPPADFFQPGSLFVVSDRLKSVFGAFGARAEFFPLRVVHRGREYAKQAYYFCNILDVVDCLDRARGEYTYWAKPGFTDRVDGIFKLAIDEARAAGHHLFRIAKGAEYIACVSDALARRVLDLGLTGMRLVAPQDWYFGCG